MTSQLQKQFFDTFGIEPKCVKRTLKLAMHGYDENDLPEDLRQFISSQAQVYHVYPEITDRILLELICLLNNHGKNDTWAISVENLKDCILMNCIKVIKEKDLKEMSLNNFKHQVRTLFKEG